MDRFIKIGEVYGYKLDETFNCFFPVPDKIKYIAVNVNHIRQIVKNTYGYARICFAPYLTHDFQIGGLNSCWDECIDTDQSLDSLVDKLNGKL